MKLLLPLLGFAPSILRNSRVLPWRWTTLLASVVAVGARPGRRSFVAVVGEAVAAIVGSGGWDMARWPVECAFVFGAAGLTPSAESTVAVFVAIVPGLSVVRLGV